MIIRLLFLASLLCLPVTTSALAQKVALQKTKQRIQITGMYSDLYHVPEAGDVVGLEIFVVYGGDCYYATVQIAEGVPEPPVLVKLQITGSSIEFSLPVHAGSLSELGKFKGKITATGLTGKFEKETTSRVLKRKKSYWQ